MEERAFWITFWITAAITILTMVGMLVWNNHQLDVIQQQLIMAGKDPVMLACSGQATSPNITSVCVKYIETHGR